MIEQRFVDVEGARLFVRMEGMHDAPVLLLHHSLATDLHSWDRVIPEFIQKYRVIRFDARGHGKSETPPGPYDFELLADDVLRIMDALEIDRAHFLGLSMGGMVGQVLGIVHGDRFRSLTLASTTSYIPPETGPLWDERIAMMRAKGMQSQLENTIGRWFTPGFIASNDPAIETIAKMIASTPVEGCIGWCEAIRTLDLTDRLGAISNKVLVVVGEEDPGTPVSAARDIHDAIAASQLAIIPNASHQAPVEQPQAFADAVLEFLD